MRTPSITSLFFAALFGLIVSTCPAGAESSPGELPKVVYPATAKVEQVDDYHGTKVADPYRWLEDDNAPATKAWVAEQNKLTSRYLEQIPERSAIRKRLTELWNYERFGTPFKEGGRYFYTKNDGLQNQDVLYTVLSLDAAPRVLLDPNTLSAAGTVALIGLAVSNDGRRMAYGIARSGSDWEEWFVRDVETGEDLPDHLEWLKFSGASWAADGSGFYYSRYDQPDEKDRLTKVSRFQKLYFHRIGTPQSADELIYHRPDKPDWLFSGVVTDDGRYLVITVSDGCETNNRVFYRDLHKQGTPVIELLNAFDAEYTLIDNDGPVFLFRTDLDAPRRRIISIDTRAPKRENWKEIVAQSPDKLEGVSVVGGRIIGKYLKDACSQVRFFDLEGRRVGEVTLPDIGSVSGFGGKRADAETFYSFQSGTTPATIYRYDIAAAASSVFRAPKISFDPADYETRQVFFKSKDGTRVPMFIVHRKSLALNGSNPTLLLGYGGFGVSLTPLFQSSMLSWMEMGGILAVPNLRGGGEYGEAWHQAGMKLKKQNVFDDLIAAAEWLIASKHTRPEKLAIMGRSNGGLLVGACMTQRPELFAAAIPAVGVMDMLRFHKFTIGWAWTSDYGSSDNADEFKALLAYSPLHNLKPGIRYPATLVTTADHDDRVVPAHSFKFAARLQECHVGGPPVLIRIETNAGHGAGKPTSKSIEEAADLWAFLVHTLQFTPRLSP